MTSVEPRERRIPGLCLNKNCNNFSKTGNAYCGTCRNRKAKMNDPIRYAYNNLKAHAKKRVFIKTGEIGIPFTITLEQFRRWCRKVKYTGQYGRTVDSFDIDREEGLEGYHIWNIKKLKKLKNIEKYHKVEKKLSFYWNNKERKPGFAAQELPPEQQDDEPDPF